MMSYLISIMTYVGQDYTLRRNRRLFLRRPFCYFKANRSAEASEKGYGSFEGKHGRTSQRGRTIE